MKRALYENVMNEYEKFRLELEKLPYIFDLDSSFEFAHICVLFKNLIKDVESDEITIKQIQRDLKALCKAISSSNIKNILSKHLPLHTQK